MSPEISLFGSDGRFHVRLSYTASQNTLKISLEKINDAMLKLNAK